MNTRSIFMSAAAMLVMAGTAVAGDSASVTIKLNAAAPNTCFVNAVSADKLPGGASFSSAGTPGTAATGTLNMSSNSVDATTARARAATYALSIDGFCNYAGHEIGLESANGGLTRAGKDNADGTFDRRIAYGAELDWAGNGVSLKASGKSTTNEADADSAFRKVNKAVSTKAAKLSITTEAGGNPLLAGDYTDTLTVRFGVKP